MKRSTAVSRIIQGILAGEHGELLSASRLARDRDRIIGAALIVERTPNIALLDAVYVTPDRQHRGLAAVLVSDALSQLYAAGFQTLESRYQLGNAASRIWHQRFGFAQQPNPTRIGET